MKLVDKMDAGPVYGQSMLSLGGAETATELYDTLSTAGSALLVKLLPEILDGTLQPKEQNEVEATYSHLIKKSDGIIDWKKSATHIEREIRAYKIWPQSRTTLGQIDVIITKAHIISENHGEPGTVDIADDLGTLIVDTSSDRLCVDALKPLGKKEMPVKAFLAGYASRLA
jgi:methionyl-tRNA formyltransferase